MVRFIHSVLFQAAELPSPVTVKSLHFFIVATGETGSWAPYKREAEERKTDN